MGPVYVNLDAGMQEAQLAEPLPPIDVSALHAGGRAAAAAPSRSRQAAAMLRQAKQAADADRPRLARASRPGTTASRSPKRCGARVVTDLKVGAASRPIIRCMPARRATFPVPEAAQAIAAADVILSLDWVDLAGALQVRCGTGRPAAKVIKVSLDHQLHNGWSMDYQALPPVDLLLAADAGRRRLPACSSALPRQASRATARAAPPAPEPAIDAASSALRN